jgi:hypothetical protein
MTKRTIIEKLVSLQDEVHRKFRARLQGIFGSYARDEQDGRSDVDVLVECETGADLFDYVGLCNFLEEQLNCGVDLVPIKAIKKEIKAAVLAEAIYL